MLYTYKPVLFNIALPPLVAESPARIDPVVLILTSLAIKESIPASSGVTACAADDNEELPSIAKYFILIKTSEYVELITTPGLDPE